MIPSGDNSGIWSSFLKSNKVSVVTGRCQRLGLPTCNGNEAKYSGGCVHDENGPYGCALYGESYITGSSSFSNNNAYMPDALKLRQLYNRAHGRNDAPGSRQTRF